MNKTHVKITGRYRPNRIKAAPVGSREHRLCISSIHLYMLYSQEHTSTCHADSLVACAGFFVDRVIPVFRLYSSQLAS